MTTMENFDKRVARINLICVLFASSVTAQDAVIPGRSREEVLRLYHSAVEGMRKSSPLFAAKTTYPNTGLRTFPVERAGMPRIHAIIGDVSMMVSAESLRVFSIENIYLFRKYDSLDAGKHPPEEQKAPTLNGTSAIEQAKQYLKCFDFALPPEFKSPTATFGGASRSRWTTRWHRFSGEYAWDVESGGTTASEQICVTFHEKDGLQSLGNESCCPAPKCLEAKFSKDKAIATAAKYVDLVQRTAFYCRARMGGFVVKAAKSCELRVAAPNWLLDPKRAVWIREGPPPETRLCWIVRFETVDTKERKDQDGKSYVLMAPDIIIYLDAGTGEVVGARFT